jgi:hypothetical protein
MKPAGEICIRIQIKLYQIDQIRINTKNNGMPASAPMALPMRDGEPQGNMGAMCSIFLKPGGVGLFHAGGHGRG